MRWPISSHRSTAAARIISAPSPSPPGIGVDELAARFDARSRRLQLDHGQGPRRPPGRSVCRIPARASPPRLGLSAATKDFPSDDLIDEKYRGIRPAPGYPACPTTPRSAPSSICSMPSRRPASSSPRVTPCTAAASVSGLYFAHPEARYFAVDRITRDQVERLRPPQGNEPSPRSNAGSRRTWATIRQSDQRRALVATRRLSRDAYNCLRSRWLPRARHRGNSPRSGATSSGSYCGDCHEDLPMLRLAAGVFCAVAVDASLARDASRRDRRCVLRRAATNC